MMMQWLSEYAPLIGLLFFFCIFVGITIWVMRPSNKKKLEAHGKIPLQDSFKKDKSNDR